MKVYINDLGEEDVNISPNEMMIDLNHRIEDYDKEELDALRKTIKEFVIGTFDFADNTNVVFGNECPDCYEELTDGICMNRYCINNP